MLLKDLMNIRKRCLKCVVKALNGLYLDLNTLHESTKKTTKNKKNDTSKKTTKTTKKRNRK